MNVLDSPEGGLAIIAGSGVLPRQLAEKCRDIGRSYQVVLFSGVQLDWAQDHPITPAEYEKPSALFKKLKSKGVTDVVFAGGMKRPKLNPLRFDFKFLKLAPTLLPSLKSGDDVTLRMIVKVFEDGGFKVVGSHEILDDLLVEDQVFSKARPSEFDKLDVERGFKILNAMSVADVGQSVVVAQGLCLGVESIQGTDALLEFVKRSSAGYKTDPKGGKGVLVKAPKLVQDWRIDLPAIGPNTVQQVYDAGLGGIVIKAGGVMVLDHDKCVTLADELGIFIWAYSEDVAKDV